MSRFEDYNPHIPYGDEQTTSHEVGVATPPAEERGASSGKRAQRQRSAKAEKQRKRPTKAAKAKGPSFRDKVKAWADSNNPRLITGILLGGVGLYFAVAFISYLTACFHDQSVINHEAFGSLPQVANKGGEGGARLAEFLINECFGLGSFVLVGWFLTMSCKLLTRWPKFKSVNFSIKCMVALITVSLIVGLVTVELNSTVNWGGYHGRYVTEFIRDFFGWSGAVILCFVMVGIFIVICLRDLIKWGMAIRRKSKAMAQAINDEKERRREEARRLEEMRQKEREADIRAGEMLDPAAGEMAAVADTDVHFNDADKAYDDRVDSYTITDTPEEAYAPRDSYAIDDNAAPVAVADVDTGEISADDAMDNAEADGDDTPMVVNVNQIAQGASKVPARRDGYSAHYNFPPLTILRAGEQRISVDAEEQMENKEKIRKTLMDFGIPITSIEATVGPTVTLYEIRPDKGHRVANIKRLVDDIALSLAATGVRIIAPIPGRGTVGIEVANKEPQTVSMRTILQSRKYQETRYKLPVAIGSTIQNEVYIADLAKMPHLLVAGATGQGKSVGLNAIITSLLYAKKPHELKFVMVDPKMVEFSFYAKLEKHYLAKIPGADEPIITDMSQVVPTLSSLCVEMDARYALLKKVGCRNVEEYNMKWNAGRLDEEDGHRFMPFIVLVVDEFADLIVTAGKEVEVPIMRLAQKARAVGMHVIIATQRPDTKVITGNIKTNFPVRIAFKTSSGVDSKTILDASGAQQLIGRGDMLVSYNSEMTRVQCAFIDTPEVEEITEYISRQPHGAGAYILPEPLVSGDGEVAAGDYGESDDVDSMFYEIGMFVVNSNHASTSNLQRKFSIGYNRAGKIMDQLEARGIVGPSQGGKPRAILVDPITAEQILNNYK